MGEEAAWLRMSEDEAIARSQSSPVDDPRPEGWLWCLHCERFFQAKDLRPDSVGGQQGCAFEDCDGAGLGCDIYPWDNWPIQNTHLRERWPKSTTELSKGFRCPLYTEEERAAAPPLPEGPPLSLDEYEALFPKIAVLLGEVRAEGFIPVFNPEESHKDAELGNTVAVDMVCPHGLCWRTAYFEEWEGGSYEWESDGWGDFECDPCADAEEGRQTACPKCSTPFPEFPEDEIISAYRKGVGLLESSRCPNCGSPWLLSASSGNRPNPNPVKGGRLIIGGRNAPCPCGSGKKFKKCCGL